MDFILTWVNGNDPEWRKAFFEYKKSDNESTSDARFRDWGNLRYWFRGVEKFAPWVHKIHFVTWGHVPEWLNTEHSKLNIIRHKDYIPQQYLPTFNSHTVELNFHRIKELSEEYVYFNDDMFLVDKVMKKDFFRNGKPCDMGLMDVISGANKFSYILVSDIKIIRKHFNKRKTISEKKTNWFNWKYGKGHNLINLCLTYVRRKNFSGFYIHHLPQASRKSTLNLLWEKEYEVMDESVKYRFRNYTTVNPYLQRYWELASNNFHPINIKKLGSVYHLSYLKNIDNAAEFIKTQKKPMICINDQMGVDMESFMAGKTTIQTAFSEILPDKSDYEK